MEHLLQLVTRICKSKALDLIELALRWCPRRESFHYPLRTWAKGRATWGVEGRWTGSHYTGSCTFNVQRNEEPLKIFKLGNTMIRLASTGPLSASSWLLYMFPSAHVDSFLTTSENWGEQRSFGAEKQENWKWVKVFFFFSVEFGLWKPLGLPRWLRW